MPNEFVARNGIIGLNNSSITGSLGVTSGITGSLYGTSSWAENTISSSYALTSSFAVSASWSPGGSSASASYAFSASYAMSTSYANFANTASSADNFTVRNTLTAVTIVAQVITSSTDYVSGSTITGNILSNTHQFTGSVTITGSLDVNGQRISPVIPTALTSNFTSSSATNTFYNTVYENRLLVDCSTNTFFTWTSSFNTQNFYFSSSFLTSSVTSSSGVVTLALPPGGVNGDIYLVGVGSRTGVPDLPAGWTSIDATTSGNTNSRTMYLVQTSSVVPSNPAITTVSAQTVAFAMIIRNANTSSFFARSGSAGVNNGMPTFTPITSSADNTLVVGMGYINSSVTNISVPTGSSAGFTLIRTGSIGTTTNAIMTAMSAFKITGSAQVNPGKFIGGGAGRPGVSGSWVAVTVAFPSISGSLSLPKAVAFTNFPLPTNRSYEMTHLVNVEATSSTFWTSSLNSFKVTWPNNIIPFQVPGQTSVYKLLTTDGGSTIFGQNITDISPETFALATTSSFTPNLLNGDVFTITAQASSLSLNNPIGAPINNQRMILRIKDDGTARALNFTGSQYRASTDIPFPLSSSLGKTLYLGFIYNSTDTKWDLIAKVDNFS